MNDYHLSPRYFTLCHVCRVFLWHWAMNLFKSIFFKLKQTQLQTHSHSYTLKAACVVVKQAQTWGPSGVCQGSLQRLDLLWQWWMICQGNVPLMPSSSLPRRGTAFCGGGGASEVIFVCVPFGVWLCVCVVGCTHCWGCVILSTPWSDMNGMGETLHEWVVLG